MNRMLILMICTCAFLGCDSVSPEVAPNEANLIYKKHVATETNLAAAPLATHLPGMGSLHDPLDACSPRPSGRLIFSPDDGYQFIIPAQDGSYALGLERLGHVAVLGLYRLAAVRPLVLLEDPVQARLVRKIRLRRNKPVEVVEIQKILTWIPMTASPQANAPAGPNELQVDMDPLPSEDPPDKEPQPTPEVFNCEVPDIYDTFILP
jgi:hypothetical protein